MSEAKLKPCPLCGSTNSGIRNGSALFWPWDEEWWKPKSARENLVRAGALVLAEIERLDRSATEQGSTCCKGGA
ncbi:TPA: hypothetical protein NH348_003290 [Pseudomonas aeruginosa]|uniref:hypothetical protein n=1 Tax=Pseudomonas aeruginosa TaxID=287 RepID=UPI0039685FA6|nr:hypothetical protein [Pseudomonas aeruginosa]HCF0913228.1 hypothetical protein [Pseudomonas aeruginosa]